MTLRNDFITSKPTLDRWEVKRSTLQSGNHPVVELTITGWCTRKRKPLFVHTELVDPKAEPMKVSDVVHHYALVCEQDRPTTQHAFHLGLLGAAWDQPELPF